MRFICGVVDAAGNHRLFSADSTPTLENVDELAAEYQVEYCADWGPAANIKDAERTAYCILLCVTDRDEATLLAPRFATEVVRASLGTDRMWILSVTEVAQWMMKNRKFM